VWAWKASDAPVNIRTVVLAREVPDVPAGKFQATKVVHDLTMVLPQTTVHSVNSRWFSPDVGYVQQETETHAGERFLTRTRLRLISFKAGKPSK